jgi:4-hydroxy-L-threonine phosphate dehydrogenase PdxA
MTGWIGITLGDVTGIGPEVTLKAIAAEAKNDDTRYLLIGDADSARRLNQKPGLNLPLKNSPVTATPAGSSSPILWPNRCRKICPPVRRRRPAPPSPHCAMAPNAASAANWTRWSPRRSTRNPSSAPATNSPARLNFSPNSPNAKRTAMMLLGHDERGRWLRVALATIHISIKSVPEKLTPEKLTLAIELAAQACRDLSLPRARIAVCGLNPHAGEGGQFGDEEIKTITPTVLAAQKRGLDVVGPLSGDTVFHYALQGDFDAVVAMYHDQGLAPLKAVAFDTGVNWTLGLPFIRTSPDHGTAYDIAGKGIANPSSMIAAIRLAKQLARSRA